jgi:hypothetical protein
VFSSGVPSFLWSEAVNISNYLVNRGPTRANKGISPEEKYSKKKPHVNHLRVFGCLAYVHIPKQNCDKISSKTKKCLFMGYDDKSKVYRLYDPTEKQIVLSRDVTFDESKIGYKHLDEEAPVLEENLFPVGQNAWEVPAHEMPTYHE